MLNDWRDSYSEKLKRLKKKKNNQLALAMTPQVVGGGAGLLAGQQLGSMGATAAAKAFRPGMLAKNISVSMGGSRVVSKMSLKPQYDVLAKLAGGSRVVSKMSLKPQYDALAKLAGGTVGGIIGNRVALPITQSRIGKSLKLNRNDRKIISPDVNEAYGLIRDIRSGNLFNRLRKANEEKKG